MWVWFVYKTWQCDTIIIQQILQLLYQHLPPNSPLFSTFTFTPNWITSLVFSSLGGLSSPDGLNRQSLTNVPLLLLVSRM